MNVGFVSLGCSKNLVDSEYIISLFKDERFKIEKDPSKCDVIIINTCGFILSAKQEAIDTILEMAEYKKDRLKKLIVTGCFVERYKEELIKEFPEVDAFLKFDDYEKMKEIFTSVIGVDFLSSDNTTRTLLTPSYFAYLKISEGCNHRCAYCAIPNIRGRFKSVSMEELLIEAKRLADMGIKELNVIGQDTAFYGIDLYHHFALSELLEKLDELPFTWIRLLYLYPDEMDDKLLKVIKNSKHILPYFDMPVQYGSDKILKAMRRPTTAAYLKERFDMIHTIFNGEEILRTTFMVGFPGEEEEDFNETLAFIKQERFDSLGAFTYSREEDTPAYNFDNQVDEDVKQKRYEILMQAQKKIVEEKNFEKIGKTYQVLIEKNEAIFNRSIGRAYFSAPEGVDPNIIIENAPDLDIGSMVEVKIKGYRDYDLIGELA